MSNQITMSPVRINAIGTTKVERQLSVIENASTNALTASLGIKGKVGNAIRANAVNLGNMKVLNDCINGNYRSLAETIAIRLGEPFVISNRASFESLPDQFEMRIMKIEQSKSGGMREDKKTGLMVAGAKLQTEMYLKSMVTDIIGQVSEYHAQKATAIAE